MIDRQHLKALIKEMPEGEKYTHYIDHHGNRFNAAHSLIDYNIDMNSNFSILEVSTLPFVSHRYRYAKTYVGSVESKNRDLLDYKSRWFNLCYGVPDYEEWDLIIITEVLEHLPMNLDIVMKDLIDKTKDGGYILTSLPMGKVTPIESFNKDVNKNKDIAHRKHIREFNEDTANYLFSQYKELHLVDKTLVKMPQSLDVVTYLFQVKK